MKKQLLLFLLLFMITSISAETPSIVIDIKNLSQLNNDVGNFDNQSWNQTGADLLYYSINNPFNFYNSSNAPTYLNDTWAGNQSNYYNKSQVDTNITHAIVDLNNTLPIRFTNFSSFNSTQFQYSGGFINILTTWIDLLYCKLTGCNMEGDLNMSKHNINNVSNIAADYIYSQPITGSIGSGIIWVNGTNEFAEVNVSCVGLTCSWNTFKVRLVNTTNDEKYCDIQPGSKLMTDNQHSVLYVDNNCQVQETSIQTYIETPISPGGIADFGNVVFEGGTAYNTNGLGLENKRIIKLRKILLQSTGRHLSIVDGGLNIQYNTFPQFNITNGQYVYLMDIVKTTKQVTGTNQIEGIYHTGASTWESSNYLGLNTTWCDTGSTNQLCTNTNLFRRVFIFMVGYNETNSDNTKLHQLLPSQSVTYTTIAQCLDTNDYPLTYTLPEFYQYSGVMLYAYCARPSDATWTTSNLIDLRALSGGGNGGATDTSPYLRLDGTTPMNGNLNMSGYNITNIDNIKGNNLNVSNATFMGYKWINRGASACTPLPCLTMCSNSTGGMFGNFSAC